MATKDCPVVHGHTSLHPWLGGHDGRPVENIHDRLLRVASSDTVLSAAEVRTSLPTCYGLELENLRASVDGSKEEVNEASKKRK